MRRTKNPNKNGIEWSFCICDFRGVQNYGLLFLKHLIVLHLCNFRGVQNPKSQVVWYEAFSRIRNPGAEPFPIQYLPEGRTATRPYVYCTENIGICQYFCVKVRFNAKIQIALHCCCMLLQSQNIRKDNIFPDESVLQRIYIYHVVEGFYLLTKA